MKCIRCNQEAIDEELGLCDYCACEDLHEEWVKEIEITRDRHRSNLFEKEIME